MPKSILQLSESSRWTAFSVVVGLFGFWYWTTRTSSKRVNSPSSGDNDAASTDPGLLKKGTSFESYTTPSGHVYPKIRTFYHAHPKAAKLPNDLPLLVFIHGLGGSAAQFVPLMTSLVNIAPCLAIDLPGCGLSDFKPNHVAAYTGSAFAELLYCAIDRFRNKDVDQKVILIGHSMGCSISALLTSSTSPLTHIDSKYIVGMVAICPRSSTLSAHDLTNIQRLNWMPSRLFDMIRLLDRRGGVNSASVLRMVGKGADLESRKLQLRFNEQSKSPVFQRFLQALRLQETSTATAGDESLLGRRIWSGIRMPLFLIAAENDRLAPPREVEQITTWLTQLHQSALGGTENVASSATPDAPQQQFPGTDSHDVNAPTITSVETEMVPNTVDSIAGEAVISDVAGPGKPAAVKTSDVQIKSSLRSDAGQHIAAHSIILKTSIFPSPASHGLLYATADARILSGLVENFLAKHVDPRLSPGWQLQHLTTNGKWDVKNLKKWQSIDPCSDPIGGVFRAMKTMREVDDVHCPREFVRKFSSRVILDGVAMIVDISHETPVYDKNGLEDGGVDYHKFPTVSKLPPTADEVEKFLALIDDLRQSPKIQDQRSADGTVPTIGVHCHYGFNRTGFFIICYLVERLGWKLQDAIEEFATKRPPGIKHEYFVNELFVRYAVKMERRGTVIA